MGVSKVEANLRERSCLGIMDRDQIFLETLIVGE